MILDFDVAVCVRKAASRNHIFLHFVTMATNDSVSPETIWFQQTSHNEGCNLIWMPYIANLIAISWLSETYLYCKICLALGSRENSTRHHYKILFVIYVCSIFEIVLLILITSSINIF